jgi:hypothetical protein
MLTESRQLSAFRGQLSVATRTWHLIPETYSAGSCALGALIFWRVFT